MVVLILVIGGIASGKRSYVRSLGYGDHEMSGELGAPAPVLLDLDELLRAGALDSDSWQTLQRKQVICCCEVGQGVVPLDGNERAWRELVGRTCSRLATEASCVIRMVCGIHTVLKQTRSEGA